MCFLVLLSRAFITACSYLYFSYHKASVTKRDFCFCLWEMLNLLFLERCLAALVLTNYFDFFHLVFCFPSLLFCINPLLLTFSGQQSSGSMLSRAPKQQAETLEYFSVTGCKSIPTYLIGSHLEISCDGSHVFLLHCLFLPNWAMAAGDIFLLALIKM